MKTLILGGVRSGKSRLAESLAVASGLPVTYLATATAEDGEMAARIQSHRRHRDPDWRVVEESVALAAALIRECREGHCVIVDCLTLWLNNLLFADDGVLLARERDALTAILPGLPGELILVGNETNLGVIPLGELTRRFCDESGRLHQQLARSCDRVVLTVAGLPLTLKGNPL